MSTVVYDGFVLFIVYYFAEYPLEKLMIVLSVINPIDLGRILFLIKINIAALMGYTGAKIQQFSWYYYISCFYAVMDNNSVIIKYKVV